MFFLGIKSVTNLPIKLNGSLFVMFRILKKFVASAAEAKLGALFINCKKGRITRSTLREMDHPQPPKPINYDYMTAEGIANDTVKKQRSRSMVMRFSWVTEQVKTGAFDVPWHPVQENMGD